MDTKGASAKLAELLGLGVAPVAVAFRSAAPSGVGRIERAGPAGCAYWRAASEGRVFYTEAEDHYNCPVGSYTHGVTLPSDRAKELEAVVGTMVGLQYIRMEEVQALPRRTEAFGVAIYAPLADAPVEPDVVLVRGNARQIMLVAEAARAAGIGHDGPTLGRPACSMIPEALRSRRGNTSLGCIGNRVYTGLGDGELYFTIPGAALVNVVQKLETIVHANRELEQYHDGRRRTIGMPGR
ncbi:MAG TPA: DUF169 domain-containing protein [Candidatus Methylomirabilis sp.]|nr:DUF169 domain-containing protein [Candidatus Methylomirabilis sp.]